MHGNFEKSKNSGNFKSSKFYEQPRGYNSYSYYLIGKSLKYIIREIQGYMFPLRWVKMDKSEKF